MDPFNIGGVNMGSGEQSGPGGRSNWPVRIAGGVGGAAGAALALLWRPDLGGFWPGLMGYLIMTGVGAVLGQLVGERLFRPSSGGPPDHPPHA
jgi:hypothetical protein